MSDKRLPDFCDPDPRELLPRTRLTKEGTETIDLESLFTANVSTSGSFDIRENIWATTFGKLIQALPIPAFLIDREHTILHANQACSRISPKHEVFLGNPFCHFVRDSEAHEKVRLLLEEVFVKRKTKVVEAVLSIEGSEVWSRTTFRSLRIMKDRFILALVEDLTKEKRQLQINERLNQKLERQVRERTVMLTEANERLQQAEHDYKSLFEKAPLMYVVTRNEQGVPFISDCNALFLKSVGYLREEVLGKSLADFYTPESISELLEGGGYARARGAEFVIGERQLRARNGSLIPTLLYVAPEEDSSGRVIGTRAMFVDITERKSAEEALRKTNSELGERVKELNCLYGLSKLIMIPGMSLDEILQGVVDLIPRGWQYPEITCARINLEGREFKTENFAGALCVISADIVVNDERIGRLEVGHVEKRPDSDEGPFLIQERQLLNAIAERLGRVAARIKTEGALRESEALYRQLVENLNGIVFSVDTRRALNYVSPQIERLLGYQPSEILGQPYDSFVHRDDIADVAESFADIWQGRLYPSEFRLRKKSGDYAWVQSSSRPNFKGEQTIGITGIAFDITDRKKVEDKLRESEERYRIFFNTSSDCVFMTTSNGRFMDFNGTALEMFGYAPDEREQLLQTKVADVYANQEEREAHVALVSKQGFSKDYPVDFRKKDGTIFHTLVTTVARIDPHGTVIGFQGTIRDITDRKRAEVMLIESEERHRALLKGLLDSLPDIVFFKDLGGIYLGCNQRFANLVGRRPEEIIGHTDYDLFAEEVADFFRENDRLMLELGEPRHNEEWTDYPDGHSALVDTIKAPLRSPDGECIGVIGISRDITDRNRAEQRLRESEENFRTFFETLDDLIVVATPEGRITFTNNALKNKLGYGEDEIQDMHVLDLHPPDKRKEAERIFAEMFRGERDSCPLPLARKNGALMPVETRIWIGKWSGVDCIFGICKDLSKEQAALQKFNRLFGSNPALMALSRMPNRILTEVNESFLATLGYSREEVLGKKAAELGLFVQPEREQEIAEAIQKEGRLRNVELAVRAKDGSILEGLFSAEIIESQGEKSLLSVMIDITERKRAQLVLKEREASLRAILNNIPFLMWLKDSEGRFLAVNDLFAKSCGRESPDEVMGKTDFEIYPPELAERYRADDRDVMRTKVQKYVEEPIFDRGEAKWFETFKMPILDKDGSVLGTTGFARDITDRKQEHIEERRRAQEAQKLLATAVEQAADAILITDASGNIQYVNPAFEQVFGYARNEAIGQNPRFVKSGTQTESFYRDLWKTIGSGKTWKGAFTNKTKDGTLVHDETTISPVKDSAGKIVSYVGVKKDVSALVRLQRQLAQAQKMEAIGTLAAGIAHDFNNIIFAITGYTELAMEEVPEGSEAQSDLQRVLHASSRAGDMVKQILAFSRQGQPERKSLDLALLIKEGLKFLRASIPSTVEIRQKIALGLGKVSADPTQLHQVLMNLCANATHAMRDGKGVLSVSLSSTRVDTAFAEKHPPLVPGIYVTLTVADTGHGIPPELLDRIFEPYFTTKPTGEGTGLGLSVLYGIVRSLGGIVTVTSGPRQGTTFTVYLPVVEDEPAEEETAVSGQFSVGHERILLVDDEQILVEMEQSMLERLGYEVVAQTSPVQALEVFRSDPKRFDLVVTDLTMPRMTGLELAAELTSIRPGVPLILCTGFSEKIRAEDVKELGFGAMVGKPILKKDIAKIIRGVLDKKES